VAIKDPTTLKHVTTLPCKILVFKNWTDLQLGNSSHTSFNTFFVITQT